MENFLLTATKQSGGHIALPINKHGVVNEQIYWISSVGLREPLNGLGVTIVRVKCRLSVLKLFTDEVTTLELGNPKSVMIVSIRKAKHGVIKGDGGVLPRHGARRPFCKGLEIRWHCKTSVSSPLFLPSNRVSRPHFLFYFDRLR